MPGKLKLTRGQFLAKATRSLAGSLFLSGLSRPVWASPQMVSQVPSTTSSDEILSLQEKISELDADLQVRTLREKASLIPGPIKSLTIPIREVTAPMLVDGNIGDGQVALSFDDGPNPNSTPLILDTLAKHRLFCHFFCVGARARENSALTRQAAAAGHMVGSHSLDHPHLPALPAGQAHSQIMDGHAAIESAINGAAPPFFRFPYGEKSKALQAFLTENKLVEFGWNMDPNDWKFDTEYQRDLRVLLREIMAAIDEQKGGILLLHDQQATALVLEDVLNHIKINGLTVVTFVPNEEGYSC